MASSPLSLPTTFTYLLLLLSLSTASATTLRRVTPDWATDSTADDAPPYRYFEVTKPIATPPTKPCSHLVLRHQFGFTYGKPPVTADYAPPSHCGTHTFSTIVLEWTAASEGRQFDRIFGVWLGGAELLRSCTAEPRATGIVWTVKKDITRYRSLLAKNNTLAVYLGNLVTSTYTGVYDVNVTIHFYTQNSQPDRRDSVPGFGSDADLILPISRNSPSDAGLWFEIENATSTETAQFRVPENVYRAVLEVYVSFHESDEFWYTNLPNDYLEANDLTDLPGNGPFREVTVALDGDIIGSVWPFTVIFTGGINPLFWRPITGIASFDLPSYDIEITPILARILDGKPHEFGFSVTNGLNVWYVDANLHLWIDNGRTKAGALSHFATPLGISSKSDFTDFDGNFSVRANRSITSIGWVKSSFGNITTRSVQNLGYVNTMVMGNEANMQIVDQLIRYDNKIDARISSNSWTKLIDSRKRFEFQTYSNLLGLGNGTESFVADVLLGFNEKLKKDVGFGFGFGIGSGELKNVQKANGSMSVNDNLVSSGIGSTKQVYRYNGCEVCYFRNISSSNYTILYDKVVDECGGGGRRQLTLPLRMENNK